MNKSSRVACLIVACFLNAADGMAAAASPAGHSAASRQANPPPALAGSKPHPQPASASQVHAPPARVRPVQNGPDRGMKAASAQPFVIAIDAGHGGKDTGAIGYNGTLEKDVVYAIARRLESLVRSEPGMRPLMVRKGDTFIGLARRAEIARDAEADLFISIHADAHTDGEAKGSAVFILSPRRVEYADFAENTLKASGRAAGKILGELRKRQYLHYRHVQKARFAVLKSPDVPSMLIETGFVSNPEEERLLASPPYQEKVARSIFNGIRAYVRAVRSVPDMSIKGKGVVVASRQ